jgi:glutamine kinase
MPMSAAAHAPQERLPDSKADALRWLKPRLTHAYVLDQVTFAVPEWETAPDRVIDRILATFPQRLVIVRSSAANESSATSSNSGVHLSIPDIDTADARQLRDAIGSVIASYKAPSPANQVLVQPLLKNVRFVAVISTMDRDTAAPYFTFTYSDVPDGTDAITSGTGRSLRQYVRLKACREKCPTHDLDLALAAVTEVEALAGVPLEVELAVDAAGHVCLFQARPVIDCSRGQSAPAAEIESTLEHLVSEIRPGGGPDADIFGVMPDWNPAELIGVKPTALAFSCYDRLFAAQSWAEARRDLGYHDMTGTRLVRSFAGCPYVDVRASFSSLTPAGLTPELREKLVRFHLTVLRQHPHLHDKVEFDVVISCLSPGFARKARKLAANGFPESEIAALETALRHLTAELLAPELVSADMHRVANLPRFMPASGGLAERLRAVLDGMETCERQGALPFARLARLAFVAVQCLKEFVAEGQLQPVEFDTFFRSLRTAVSQLHHDLARVRTGGMSLPDFHTHYGHLRPGTYDLMSRRYDEAFETYFGPVLAADSRSEPEAPEEGMRPLSPWSREALGGFLSQVRAGMTPDDLLAFFKAAIESREQAKLQFTRLLSDCLREIQAACATAGIAAQDAQHLRLEDLDTAAAAGPGAADVLHQCIARNRAAYRRTLSVRLPDLILRREDFLHFDAHLQSPNFITKAAATGRVVTESGLSGAALAGAVVCVRAADPGYDWIFVHGIGGLVTRFGGANSHMAVRCAELGIPAVIGCGESDFRRWSAARVLRVDCATQVVNVVV